MRAGSALCPLPSAFRAGYSFTEVMFAVVVLGIGFIMIAAMFPVAISQSKSTQEETNAASMARGAAAYVGAIATRYNMPATGTTAQPNRPRVYSLRDPQATGVAPTLNTLYAGDPEPLANTAPHALWNALKGNLILSGDSRYAYTVLYRRSGVPDPATGAGSTSAQVFIVACQVRARSTYSAPKDLVAPSGNANDPVNLQPRPVTINITPNGGGPGVDWITFTGGATDAVAEGTYVIVAEGSGAGPGNEGLFNGRVYRVGAAATSANTWEFAPGNDYRADPGPNGEFEDGGGDDIDIANGAQAFVIGRQFNDAGTGFEGLAQDIALYSTFVTLR